MLKLLTVTMLIILHSYNHFKMKYKRNYQSHIEQTTNHITLMRNIHIWYIMKYTSNSTKIYFVCTHVYHNVYDKSLYPCNVGSVTNVRQERHLHPCFYRK